MRNVSNVVIVKNHSLIDRLPLRTIVCTAPTVMTITSLHAVISVDTSSVQVFHQYWSITCQQACTGWCIHPVLCQ